MTIKTIIVDDYTGSVIDESLRYWLVKVRLRANDGGVQHYVTKHTTSRFGIPAVLRSMEYERDAYVIEFACTLHEPQVMQDEPF